MNFQKPLTIASVHEEDFQEYREAIETNKLNVSD